MTHGTHFSFVSMGRVLERFARVVGPIALVASAAGCQTHEKIDSTDVRSHGVYADFSVLTREGGQAEAKAQLRTGTAESNTYLELTGDDRLVVRVGSEFYLMQDRGAQNYSVIFPVPAVDAEVHIVFERGPDDTSARDSSIMLPDDFALLPLLPRYSRGQDPLEANWTPSAPGKTVDFEVSGNCIESVKRQGVADAGTVSLYAGALRPRCTERCSVEDTTCTATVRVTKTRDGRLDPAFSGGSFVASAQRSGAFVSIP